jgi:hypothetical protein
LILHTPSIFFKEGHLSKIWSKKYIFFLKILSKLGALTVAVYVLKSRPFSPILFSIILLWLDTAESDPISNT